MRVFLTGATGFIGSMIVEELLAAGHQVTGLARSEAAAQTLAERGVEPRRGDVADPEGLAEGARASDGVIHCAFGHDFSRYVEMGDVDLRAVSAMAQALARTGKPLVVTSGPDGPHARPPQHRSGPGRDRRPAGRTRPTRGGGARRERDERQVGGRAAAAVGP